MGENVVKAKAIHRLLLREYGPCRRRGRLDPVSQLISAILSQNTNDGLRDRAYNRLRHRFPTWEEVRDAPVEEIMEAIRPAGLAPQKAPRIKAALERISRERGELSLEFLRGLPVEEAKGWLASIKGVGLKTAAIVLLFSLGHPAFPVDTHVYRVCRRLGLLDQKISREKAHQLVERLIAPGDYCAFHLNLIAHGREVCKAQRPRCEICVLAPHCDYFMAFKSSISGTPEGS